VRFVLGLWNVFNTIHFYLDRKDFRRVRQPTGRDARMTEQLERKQGAERKHRKIPRAADLNLCTRKGNGRHNLCALGSGAETRTRGGMYHVNTEKGEAKRVESISKMCLKALKANDEEAHMKLIDTAKDIRFTHLLR
jgi:ATP-dependent helicase STH1/SNF2